MKAAVVGVGHLGKHHARIYAQMEGVELVGVADLDEEAGREVAVRHGARWYGDYRELPAELDLVSVATPTRSHYEVARYFLDKGIPVLVEKPLTQELSEGEALVKFASERGVVLQVGHVERFNPAFLAFQRLGVQPRFVECARIAPFSFRSTDVGVVLDLMIHDLDLVLHLVQSEVKNVEALGVSVLGMKEDIANARISFENGCVANVTASRVSMKTERKIRLFAPTCYASLDFSGRQGYVYRRKGDAKQISDAIATIDPKSVIDPKAFLFGDFISAEQIEMDDHEPLKKELESFVQAVRTGETPVVSGEAAVKVLALAQRILDEIGQFQERSVEFLSQTADQP